MMTGLEGVRIVDVDGALGSVFLDYARTFGPAHDDSYVGADELTTFDPAAEPAVLALDDDVPLGAASVMVKGYAEDGLARFRILHAADPALYAPMLSAVLTRIPASVERVFLFLPEHPGEVAEPLAQAGFAESRRAYIMLDTRPPNIVQPELPGETIVEQALPTHASDWANVVNAAFHGQPGCYRVTAKRAAELLGRERVIRAGTLMACRGGAPSGVVLTVVDEDSPYSAEIETLAVVPREQHVGLGRALLHAALKAAVDDGHTSVHLSVSTFNKRALAMYIDAGFGVDDVRVCWELKRA